MFLPFISSFIFGLFSLLIVYSIGKFFSSFFTYNGNRFFQLFVVYVIGVLSIIVLYSMVKAHGKTIMIAIIPILGYILFYYRNYFQKPHFSKLDFRFEIGYSIVIFAVIFCYQSFFFYDFFQGTVKSLFWDNYAYASYVDSLKLWGSETRYIDMNWFIPEFRTGLVPYHYPELWLSAFVSKTCCISSIKAYYLITNSMLISMYIFGICSLMETKIKNTFYLVSIAILLLFVAGLSFSWYGSIRNHALWFVNISMLGLLGSKATFLYLFLLLSFIFYKRQNNILAYSSLIVIPFFSIGLMPGIWGGLILFTILKILYQKFKIKSDDIFVLASILMCLLIFGLFYYLFKSQAVGDNATNHIFNGGIFKNLPKGNRFLSFKIIVSNFIVYALPSIILAFGRIIIFFLPYLIVSYSSIIRNRFLWILSCLTILCGATVSTICSGLLDSSQFTTNLGVLFCVLIMVGIIELITEPKSGIVKYSLLFSAFFLLFLNTKTAIANRNAMKDWHDDDHVFLSKIAQKIKNDKTVLCMIFLSEYEYSRQPYLWWYDRNDLDLLTQYSDATFVYSMGNPEVCFKNGKIPESEIYAYNHLTPINAWKNKKMGNDLYSFINAKNIKYFYFKKDVPIPDFIAQNNVAVIISESTGSKFYILK